MPADELTVGPEARRSGVSVSALRSDEEKGLLRSRRTAEGQRRYARNVLRRAAFVRAAQQAGVARDEVCDALRRLPDERTRTAADRARPSARGREGLDARILTASTCGSPSLPSAARAPLARIRKSRRRHRGGGGGAEQHVAAEAQVLHRVVAFVELARLRVRRVAQVGELARRSERERADDPRGASIDLATLTLQGKSSAACGLP